MDWEANSIRQLILALSPSLYGKILYQTGATAQRAGTTRIAKVIGEKYSLQAKRIKEGVRNGRIDTGIGGNPSIRWLLSESPITLRTYGFYDNGRQVRGSIMKGIPMKWYRSFQVKGEKGKYKGLVWTRKDTRRYPIYVPKGPSISRILLGDRGSNSKEMLDNVKQRVAEQWMKGFEQSFRRYFPNAI